MLNKAPGQAYLQGSLAIKRNEQEKTETCADHQQSRAESVTPGQECPNACSETTISW